MYFALILLLHGKNCCEENYHSLYLTLEYDKHIRRTIDNRRDSEFAAEFVSPRKFKLKLKLQPDEKPEWTKQLD